MKVTFVLPFFSRRPIGGLRVVYELANVLSSLGHEVTIVHPRELAGIAYNRSIRGVASKCLDAFLAFRGVPWIAVDPKVKLLHVATIDESALPRADIVLATSWQTAAPVAALSHSKGRKHYLVMDFYPYIASRETLESSWRSGYRLATISNWLARMVLAAGVDPKDVTSISCGVSSLYRMREPPDHRPPSIAMMYGLGNYKASGDGIRALKMARSEAGPFRVQLFGANSSRRPAGLPDWAEYRPLLTNDAVSGIYNASAIFVSSSVAEGFCLPAAEAMSSGCAVAATDSGGIQDFAVDGQTALLSPPGAPEPLARNIVRLLRDPALRVRLAYAGHEAIQRFTWEASARRLMAFAVGEPLA